MRHWRAQAPLKLQHFICSNVTLLIVYFPALGKVEHARTKELYCCFIDPAHANFATMLTYRQCSKGPKRVQPEAPIP